MEPDLLLLWNIVRNYLLPENGKGRNECILFPMTLRHDFS